MNREPSYQSVVIIGAPRSGTNMLRDVLTALPGYGSWLCDEINYIWRHRNARFPLDEFSPAQATPHVRKFIRRACDRLVAAKRIDHLVEKTCANSLRVGFVDRVLPAAKYIFLVRDGRDVIASAVKRWRARMDWRYVAKKARFVPAADVPLYASRYVVSRLHRLVTRERRLASWGPRFLGMEQLLRDRSLPEVCAAQWARCVDRAEQDLAQIDSRRVVRIQYEQFVAQPCAELRRIVEFLESRFSDKELVDAVQGVSPRSIGNWKTELAPATLRLVEPMIKAILQRLGYLTNPTEMQRGTIEVESTAVPLFRSPLSRIAP